MLLLMIDLDEFADKLTRFNINSFLEVLLATIAGAVFAFVGSWSLNARDRRRADDRRTRDAVIGFLKWMAEEGLPARRAVGTYSHYLECHPERVAIEFPDGVRFPSRAVELAEIQRMALNVTGIMTELVSILKNGYKQDENNSEWVAYVHWVSFSDTAGAYLQGDLTSRNQVLDAYREKEARLQAEFPNRFEKRGCCQPT